MKNKRNGKKRPFKLFIPGLFIAALIILFPGNVFPGNSALTLVPFQLKDQFGQTYTEKDYCDSIVVMTGTGKGGAQYNVLWTKAIIDFLEEKNALDKVKFIGVADLRPVPFFLKGFVKSKFPKQKEKWVLMDWKGHLPKSYRFEPKHSNIVIFGRDGVVAHKTSGRELDQQKLISIQNKLKTLLGN